MAVELSKIANNMVRSVASGEVFEYLSYLAPTNVTEVPSNSSNRLQ